VVRGHGHVYRVEHGSIQGVDTFFSCTGRNIPGPVGLSGSQYTDL
jgi:hypothetical protein